MRLVLVEWLDSYGCSSKWQDIDNDVQPKALACSSVGLLLYDGDDCKVIVPHFAKPESDQDILPQGCGDMTIPTRAILEIILGKLLYNSLCESLKAHSGNLTVLRQGESP